MAAPNFANRTLSHVDNLLVLRGMNGGSVHLIATDPPFNRGKDFHAMSDAPEYVLKALLRTPPKTESRWR